MKVRRKILLPVLVALTLLVAALMIPRPAAAQVKGPYFDEIIYQVVDQTQVLAALEANDIDMYIFTIENPEDKQAAIDSAIVDTFMVPTGIRDMMVNPVPHGPGVGGFNPFTIREVREALNWAIDRDHIINEIMGGFALPYISHYIRQMPDWARDPGFFFGLESKYAYNPQRAMDQVTAAMEKADGVTWDATNDRWLYNGAPITIQLAARVEDLRKEIGAYVATEVEKLGFAVLLDPVTGLEAWNKVYIGDSTAGQWHLYTEGWGFGALQQFDDTSCNFFFNGDLGSDLWDYYTPPRELTSTSVALERAEYATLDERQQLLRTCSELGAEDGIRIFMIAPLSVYGHNNAAVKDIARGALSGNLNFWGQTTARQVDGTVGGTLRIAQPIHTVSGWNPWAGFTWVYESFQQLAFSDPGVTYHPHLGTGLAYRLDFDLETAGLGGTKMDVPADAVLFNVTSMKYEPIGSGSTSISKVTYTANWGTWHHGEAITLDDWKASMAMRTRLMEGDLQVAGPSFSSEPTNLLYHDLLKGIEFIDDDTIVIWFDLYNPDETSIAPAADWWPDCPWTCQILMADLQLAGDAMLHDDDASDFGVPQIDGVKGPSLALLAAALAVNKAANTKPTPDGFDGDITDAEATAHWAALEAWWTDKGHFMVANGPFYIDSVTTVPEGTVLKAFRTGYPFDVDYWDWLIEIRIPGVTIGAVPEVIQTFPATFTIGTEFGGQTYDKIGAVAWLVTDPATRLVLFQGDATRVDAGEFEVTLDAAQTTALVEGTYQFTAIVIGEEAATPGFAEVSFATLNINTVLLRDLTETLDTALAGFQEVLDQNAATSNDAVDAANSAVSLTNLVLAVAIVAVVLSVVGIAALLLVWRRLPPPT